MYYSAAWTDSGFLLGCSHEHETIVEADSCIPCAGGYVVAVENGVMRSLTAEEESEFQGAHYERRTDNPAVETTPIAPAEAAASNSGYAVMTRIKVRDRWTWTTWMRFGTYAEAAAHARDGNKVVRFRSPEWAAFGRWPPGAKSEAYGWSSFSQASRCRMPMWKASTAGYATSV